MTDASDPFRQLLEQFGAGGSQTPPPAPGFLLPFPMPGSDAAPAERTKRAVRQLYGAIAGLSGSDSGETLLDAWQQYADLFDVEGSLATAPAQVGSAAVTTYRVWFASLAQLLVESYTVKLLHDELVVDRHRWTSETQQWLWGLPQSTREQLLWRCTDVEDDLVGEMEAARASRDELLYAFGAWSDAEFETALEDARRYLRVLTALDDLAAESGGFSYFPADATAESSESETEAEGSNESDT